MPPRKRFDLNGIDADFWSRQAVTSALARRDMTALLREFFLAHPGCTQTQLAVLIEHDRAEVSAWVRGTRQAHVRDIEVLTRIADGLGMPDQSRVTLGLAPADAVITSFAPSTSSTGSAAAPESTDASRPTTLVGICGSRTPHTNTTLIDATIPVLARAAMLDGWIVRHGPIGVGIEVTTHIVDHYHPPGTRVALGIFGHREVVEGCRAILVLGGGTGTHDEIDLALSMGITVLCFPHTGGTAHHFYTRSAADLKLRAGLPDGMFDALADCDDPEEFCAHAQTLINHCGGTQ